MIVDGVWDALKASHLAVGSFGEAIDWILNKDTNRTFDRSTDSLEAISDKVTVIDGIVDSIKIQTDKLTFDLDNNVSSYVDSLDADGLKIVVDGVWDALKASHLVSGSFGEAIDWILNKDVNRTFDRSTDSLEAISDKVTVIDVIVDSIKIQTDKLTFDVDDNVSSYVDSLDSDGLKIVVDGVWDALKASHLVSGSFGEAVDWILNKDTNRTFDRSTDSLEAISDKVTVIDDIVDNINSNVVTIGDKIDIIDAIVDTINANVSTINSNGLTTLTMVDDDYNIPTILKRINAILHGNGSTKSGDVYTYKDADGSAYLRHTIASGEVTIEDLQ
jgi:CII-binding regulator of phage lambda lysogenization HflD